MEFEQLEAGRRCITAAIASQDVGGYYSILHPDIVLVTHFCYPPMPPAAGETIPLLARAQRRAEAARSAALAQKGKTRGSSLKKSRAKSPKVKSPKLKTSQTEKSSEKTATRSASAPVPDDLDSLPYAERVDVVEGALLAAERMYCILSWLNRGRYIANTTVELEARKVILQESEVLTPAPSPRNEAERYAAMGRQHTDRNQRLSRLLVQWGHEDLLFRDECYFEDGFIVTVQRHMLTSREMLALNGVAEYHHLHMQQQRKIDAMAAARKSFYAVRSTRIDSTNHATLPLLDFTFCPATEPVDLLRSQPVAGRRHVERIVEPLTEAQIAQGVFLNQQSDPMRSQKEQRVIVKAKNKQGDEKVYEFIESKTSRYGFMHTGGTKPPTSFDTLAEKVEVTYTATSVRISGCGMKSTELLVPVLQRLVVNAIMTLHSLDLSNNHISTLPDFSILPLQRLNLQKNNISDWKEVENSICPLPLLHALSLHGNPIAENDAKYWQEALSRLLRHPNRAVPLRQLDLVTLTAQDYNMASAYEMFQTGSTKLLEDTMKKMRQ